MLCVVGGWNLLANGIIKAPVPTAPEGQPMSAQDDASRMAAQVGDVTGAGGRGAPEEVDRGRPRGPGGESNAPLAAKPKVEKYKPKPSDSSTSTQWYDK